MDTEDTSKPSTDAEPSRPKDGADHDSGETQSPKQKLLALTRAHLPERCGLVVCQRGHAYIVHEKGAGNPITLRLGTRGADAFLLAAASRAGKLMRRRDMAELVEQLHALAQQVGSRDSVWVRVAPVDDGPGVVIDLGDDDHARVRITPGRVETLTSGCATLFHRSGVSRPMCRPAAVGDIKLLDRYLQSLYPVSRFLLIAYVTYTIAHAKVADAIYVVLVLLGGQGSGKTTITKVVQELVDPSAAGLQSLPSSTRELAIAAQNAHLLAFDNAREMSPAMSDALCRAATGGTLSTRKLYSDADQHVVDVHCAALLNSIHEPIHQADLAQRSLVLRLKSFEGERRGQADFFEAFHADLPAIRRAIYDLVAQILLRLPEATIVHSERLVEFQRWIAATELVNGVRPGTYQAAFSAAMEEGQREALMTSPLAAAVLEFAEGGACEWSGTPSELLAELNLGASRELLRSRGWPSNAISLSKRLLPMQAALLAQGIELELRRGKERAITIRRKKNA